MNTNFFGEEGLTSTSASYICNIAKEKYLQLETKLENLTFYDTILKTKDLEETISYASNVNNEEIENMIDEIAQLKSLISWFREAIKKKERLSNEIASYTFLDYIRDNKITDLEYPKQEETITEEEYLDALPIKERNRYFTLETYASTIGKFIHRSESLHDARKEFYDKLENPIKVEEKSEILIYKYIPKFDCSDIEDLFFKLQTKQREYQAELNGMKNKMQEAIFKDKSEKNAKYSAELGEYNYRRDKYNTEYKEYINKESERIKKLKIVIPNNLRDIYEKIK